MRLRLPLWKIIKRKGQDGKIREYAELLLRCHADEFLEARTAIESCGTIKQATQAILKRFEASQTDDLSPVIEEMKRQHEAQLAAIKQTLKEQLTGLVYNTVETMEQAEELVDNIWEKIET